MSIMDLQRKNFKRGGAGGGSGPNNSPGTTQSGGNANTSTNQGPAGGASAGGNYGGSRNPNQTFGGSIFSGGSNSGGSNNGSNSVPPSKPKPTKDNTVKKNLFESYFNYHPVLSTLDKISKNKLNTNINAKKREKYINDLLETDPDEYNRIQSQLAKVNMIVGPQVIGSTQLGPQVKTDYGMPSAPPSMLTSNYEEIDGRKSLGDPAALEILGQKYKDTLTFPDNGGGGDNPRPLIPINYNTGAATIEDVEPYNQFTYRMGDPAEAADVTRASYIFNKGGRVPAMEGGIMGTRARRAMGGIMSRVDQRQGYFLGKIVKSVKKVVGGVADAAGKVLKSDLGKAALLAAGAYYAPAMFGGTTGFGAGSTYGNFARGLMSPNLIGPMTKAGSLGRTIGNFAINNKALTAGILGIGGAALMGPAKVDQMPGGGDRGGRLKNSQGGEGQQAIRDEIYEAYESGDQDRIMQLQKFYGYKLPSLDAVQDMSLPSSLPYPNYAEGGRIGYSLGNLVGKSAGVFQPTSASMSAGDAPSFEGGTGMGGMIADLIRKNPNMFKRSKNSTPINQNNNGMYSKMFNNSKLFNQLSNNNDFIDENMNGIDDREEVAMGGRIGKAEGGLMDLGGMEKDYRAEGGFVPIGEYEKKDDVPARLSVNEFVFTADAVRGAGQGDIDKGAEIMENMMENLENGGTISEESQGKNGAQQMFETSQRLGEVV